MTRLLKQNIRRTSLHIYRAKWVFLCLGLRREKIAKRRGFIHGRFSYG